MERKPINPNSQNQKLDSPTHQHTNTPTQNSTSTLKVSLITVSFNSATTINDTINSINNQDYKNIEYIVIDGDSKDGTIEILEQAGNKITHWISEPDSGIYDAMNKGLQLATGEIVGILNSDDFYFDDHIISTVANAFEDKNVDAVFGDLIVVDPGNLKKIVRRYSSANWYPEKLARGFMPAHPTFFVRRKFYEAYGLFKTDYKIAADYEILIRFLYVHRLRYKYLNQTMVVMRSGGVSTRNIRSNIILNDEIIRGCRENGIKTNIWKIYPKYFIKVFELFTAR
jgi:glycosyltransferase involved in cell wall biosynthesis